MPRGLVCFAPAYDACAFRARYRSGMPRNRGRKASGHAIFDGGASFIFNVLPLRPKAAYDLPHGCIGTVLIALAGEPLTIFELTAR